MTKQEFIKAIAGYVQEYAPMFGIKVCSPIIAQACLESGYGTSKKAEYHNYFGLKYRKNRVTCNSGYFEDGGSEQNQDGTYTPLPTTTAWYAFDNMRDGVLGYFQFINIPNYENLKGVEDPHKYLELIKEDGYATSLKYVENVYRVLEQWDLTQYDNKVKEEVTMSNSSLVDCRVMSPNHSGVRTKKIDRITPHVVVGQLSAERIGGCFTSPSSGASCNYGIGTDGRVVLCVDEANRSWCSSSSANDQRAVTIECASDKTHPYAVNSTVYNKLVDLCVDICKRNKKTKLIWIADKAKALAYEPASDEMLLTVHRWFANKSCPGDYLYGRLMSLANTVTARLGGNTVKEETQKFPATPFSVQVLVDDLNIRKEPKMGDNVVGQTGKGVFTIVEVVDGWGLLKSYATKKNGYIYLENPDYIKVKSTTASTPTKKELKEGDVITLKAGTTYYNGKKIPSWVFKSTLYYRGTNDRGVIFSTKKTGAVTGVVKAENVIVK